MKQRKSIWLAGALLLAGAVIAGGELSLLPAEGIAGIGKAAHADLAIFHVHTGGKPPAEINAEDEIGLLTALKGKAQILALTHTTGLKEGDVIDVQSDVLREGEGVEDFGVDCELIVHVKNGEQVSMGGRCEVFVYDLVNKKEVEFKLIIRPTDIGRHWTLIGWDEKDHVAIYADEEIGAE